eukprot:s163_g18.t1
MSDVAGLCGNMKGECMTDFHVNLYALSPFIVHMLLRQQCSPPTSDKTIQEASHGIQMDILRSKFSTENSWDTKGGDLSRDALLQRMVSAVVSGDFNVIFNPVAFHDCHGVPYEGRADLLHRIMNGSGHQYMVKVVTSTKALRPHIVMKALFCHHVLSLMLGKDSGKLHKTVAVVLSDASESEIDTGDHQKDLESQCAELRKLWKSAETPKPSAQDLRLSRNWAQIAYRRLLDEDSIELISFLKPNQKRQMRKRGLGTLSALRRASFEQMNDFMSEKVFRRAHRHAKLLVDETKDFCHIEGNHHPLPEDLRSAFGQSPLVMDVIAGPEPSLNTFLLGNRDGRCEIFHAQDVHLFVQKIMACTEVYYFGTEVYNQILQSCLVAGRADLAGKIVEGVFLRSWTDLQQRLGGSLCNKSGESMEDFCANLTSISTDVLDTFYTLPSLVELFKDTRLPANQQQDVATKLQTRAEWKTAALQQLTLWWQKNLRAGQTLPRAQGNPFVTDLLGVCRKFQQGISSLNQGGWPDDVWRMAQKWPDYYKHDLFWKLMDAIELFASSEDEWTAHVLCLSGLERARDDVRPRVSRDGRFDVVSLELEYLWKLDQETTIKEKDEVFIKEDPSLKGKVVKIENFGAGQTSKVLLLFDTKFRKNANLKNLLEPGLKRISIMQGQFSLLNGDNIMTRAVEQELLEISNLPWTFLQPSFRNFLLRQPVSASAIDEANAEEKVGNLREEYFIIQGPPGTGKTYTSAKLIQHLRLNSPSARIIVSSNSHRAIRNLLSTISSAFQLPVAKVLGNDETPQELQAEGISSVQNEKMIGFPIGAAVLGGTASQLMKLVGSCEYLFVDEAGQVTMELLAVLARKAQNLLLVGDQQQLPPPVSQKLVMTKAGGVSCLAYFTQGAACIDNRCGLFLPTTYRMSAQLTQVISQNFYADSLRAFKKNAGNRVVFKQRGLLQVDSGAEFISVDHEGNLQSSQEECEIVRSVVEQLLVCDVVLDEARPRSLTPADIFIVCPYNAQVVMIRSVLARSPNPMAKQIRVGSVDLFQGQQAAVAITSLGSSSGIGGRLLFVLDPKRTNVALSRARALSIMVGSPTLGKCRVETTEEMEIQNRFVKWVNHGF